MDKFITRPAAKYYYCLVGNKQKNFIHPNLFLPRCQAIDKQGLPVISEKGFTKTFVLAEDQVREEVVKAWSSSSQALCQLQPTEKNATNSIKTFLNSEDYRTIVVFHDKQCDESEIYSYGNHLHVVIQSTLQQLSTHTSYRSMKRQVSLIPGGYCSLKEVRQDVTSFLHYLAADEEKIFLGANDRSLLEEFVEAENYTGQLSKWVLADEEDSNKKRRTRDSAQWEYADEDMPGPSSAPKIPRRDSSPAEVPDNLRNKNPAKTIEFITNCLKEFPRCRDPNKLLSQYEPYSETWNALAQVASSHSGKEAFKIAINQVLAEMDTKTPAEIIQDLPEEIPEYMSIRHSQAMFNAWCREQDISPRKFVATLQMLLAGKGQKRIGLYLSGQPNSGKTVMTNTMFTCLNDICGRLTKDNPHFMLQNCGAKKIVIGEEIGINGSNLERFKDLMSGALIPCERKGTTSVECKPTAVLMNSNRDYRAALDKQQALAIQVRIYVFEDLKRSKVLNKMTGFIHPRMLYEAIEPPITEDDFALIRGNVNDVWTNELIGRKEIFTGSWEEISTEPLSPITEWCPSQGTIAGHKYSTSSHTESKGKGTIKKQRAVKQTKLTTKKMSAQVVPTKKFPTMEPENLFRHPATGEWLPGMIVSEGEKTLWTLLRHAQEEAKVEEEVTFDSSWTTCPPFEVWYREPEMGELTRFLVTNPEEKFRMRKTYDPETKKIKELGLVKKREDAPDTIIDVEEEPEVSNTEVSDDIIYQWIGYRQDTPPPGSPSTCSEHSLTCRESLSDSEHEVTTDSGVPDNDILEYQQDTQLCTLGRHPFTHMIDINITLNNFNHNHVCRTFTELRSASKIRLPFEYELQHYQDEEVPDRINRLQAEFTRVYNQFIINTDEWLHVGEIPDTIDPLSHDSETSYWLKMEKSPDSQPIYTTATTIDKNGLVHCRMKFPAMLSADCLFIKHITFVSQVTSSSPDFISATPGTVPCYPSNHDIDIDISAFKILTIMQYFNKLLYRCTCQWSYTQDPFSSLSYMSSRAFNHTISNGFINRHQSLDQFDIMRLNYM